MSKSEGNTVTPDDVTRQYGVDALRFAMLEGAAPESDLDWSEDRARAASRFLHRAWALCAGRPLATPHDEGHDPRVERHVEAASARVTRALAHHQFHLAARNLRLLLDRLEQHERQEKRLASKPAAARRGALDKALRTFVSLLAPLCPHVAEELWTHLGGHGLLATGPWPLTPVPRWYPPGVIDGPDQ